MRAFTFSTGFQDDIEKKVNLSKDRVSVKNIQLLVDEQNLNFIVSTVFVKWEIKRKVKRAYGSKTVYKENLIMFTKTGSTWIKKDLSRTRTI